LFLFSRSLFLDWTENSHIHFILLPPFFSVLNNFLLLEISVRKLQ
jgi:hypothetical protein